MNFGDRAPHDYQSVNHDIPYPRYGLRKDHKSVPGGDEEKGPPQRPVCGAVVASNYQISHFISQSIRPIIDQAEEPSTSTEDLLSRIEHVNENEDIEDCVIGSMDVKALYPMIDIEFSVDRCAEMIFESNVEFKNIDVEEVGLYLALTVDRDKLIDAGLEKFCPTRKTSRGRPPTITGSGVNDNKEKRWEPWEPSVVKPNMEEQRKMVCYALGVTMKTMLKNHIFRFHDQIRKQKNGGAIGVKAAADIATLFMVWWDREFKKRVLDEGIDMKLYTRYVDDENIVCKAIPETEGSIVNIPPDERTMKRLQEIGNGIHPSIQLTVDYPSKNESGRVPILDTEQWIQKVDVDGESKSQIIFSHYVKPMASRHVIHRSSAQPIKMKLNVLTADLVRIMRNVSRKCPDAEREEHVQKFVRRMQFSGYSKKERYYVYQKAKQRYDEMVRKMEEGIQPLYRSRNWNKEERQKNKEAKRNSWFKKGNNAEAVMFVETTPNGELAKRCRDAFASQGLRVKIVERTTSTIKQKLVKSNPFKERGCQKPTCNLCSTGSKANCKSREIVYQISCADENDQGVPCEGITYVGETSRSLAERYDEHANMMISVCEETRRRFFLRDHIQSVHDGNVPALEVSIIGSCKEDPSMRQTFEAVKILKQTRYSTGNKNG